MSHNIVYSKICHKYIHIMEWKDHTRKEIATYGTLFLLNSCCEQAAAEVFRAFPLHFVQLQSNSRQFNVHDLCAATENCMKCGFLYETFQMCTVAQAYCLNLKAVKMCTAKCVW